MLSHSIRQRTLILVLGPLVVALSLISLKSYQDAHHEIEELFDAQLAQSARLLQGLVTREMTPEARQTVQAALDAAVNYQRHAPPGGSPPGHSYEGKLVFQVYDARGEILLQSAAAPAGALAALTQEGGGSVADSGEPMRKVRVGYHEIALDDNRWRLFLLEDPADHQWILVGERGDVRGELAGKIAQRSLLPDVLGLPLLALLVWMAVGWGLGPLARMAQLLRNRGPDDLAPLLLAPLPQELEPVAASLNRLLQQVTQLLEREKRFIADAAHELRTPLAVLRIHAQNACSASDPLEREEALQQLIGGVDRATRLVTQLLTLARLEPAAQENALYALDFRALVRETLAELTPLTLDRDQELTFEVDESGDYRVNGDVACLSTLVQNLVSNASQYTPTGGQIQVGLQASPGDIVLTVGDSGPGVPADSRAKLFQRFYRKGGGEGAGLGLSIALRVVELHRGSIELGESPLGGLEVRVRLSHARVPAAVVAPA